jgi:hypothetical protein
MLCHHNVVITTTRRTTISFKGLANFYFCSFALAVSHRFETGLGCLPYLGLVSGPTSLASSEATPGVSG